MSAQGLSKGKASKKKPLLSSAPKKPLTDELTITKEENVYTFDFKSMILELSSIEDIEKNINTKLKGIDINLDLTKLLSKDTIIVIGENYLYKYIKEISGISIIQLKFYSNITRQVNEYNSITYLYGYEYMENIMKMFVYDRKEKVKGLFLLSYNHKFYLNADLYYKQLYDLFKLHKEKNLYVYPNPLLIFLVECKLYYYFLLKMNTEYKKIILNTRTLIHPKTMADREKFYAPRKYKFGPFGIEGINYESAEFKQLNTNVIGYLSYAKQNGYDTTKENSDYIKMGLSGSNDCATYLHSIISKSYNLALQCTNSGIILYQKKLKDIKDELRLLFFYSGDDNIIYFPSYYNKNVRRFTKINNTSYTDIIPDIKGKILNLIKELSKKFGNIFFGRVDFIIQKLDKQKKQKFILNEIELYPGPNYMSMLNSYNENKNIKATNSSFKTSFISFITNAISDKKNIPDYPGDIVEKTDGDGLTYLETMLIQLSTLLPDEHKLTQEKLDALKKTVSIKHDIVIENYKRSLKNIPSKDATNTKPSKDATNTITIYDLGDNTDLGDNKEKKGGYKKINKKYKSKKYKSKNRYRLSKKKK